MVSQVDEKLQPVPGTEKTHHCDTLILSVGLIPENELSLEAGVTLDDRSKGAVVDENYQTDVEGILQQEMYFMFMIWWILCLWRQKSWQTPWPVYP